MAFLDLLRSPAQRVKARVPAAQRKLQALVRDKGDKGLTIWLEELAFLGSHLRGARIQKLMADVTYQGSRLDYLDDPSDRPIWDSIAPSEWDWWAAQLVYNAALEEGLIGGGPGKVPDLWSEEFSEFSKACYPFEDDEDEDEDEDSTH